MTEVKAGSCAVVIVAAGSGQRLGYGVPKARVPLAGQPMVLLAIRGVIKAGVAAQICVAIPPDDPQLLTICQTAAAETQAKGIVFSVVEGGAERSDSVAAALASIAEGVTTIMIHDAARPLTPSGVFNRVAAALRDGAKAVIPALAVVDTIKTVAPATLPATGAGVEKVVGTPARSVLRAVQTPQGFRLDTLRQAHAHALTLSDDQLAGITDDAMLVEALGEDVFVVQGSTHSLKITSPTDLLVAEALLEGPLRPRWIEG
ncbi:2-C-methyl-D-erythritol 4-phosphate cytidylyltransferase [Arthrobacter alpinus]|uniref:2-C-methyl-D-erythritol 4-phosphate cytidylyltransferase n=1 Tax=Arthrobacter alpinus TaxID=656366 RepID=A0A0S2LUV2_9MICC|nr:2-C-methyl-D-erythritol 4-phosphate cytidylyltransferase [Arthrobacter alpinus]ALO65182.1 2-C-methyl-D-erythritol 4-phosphate cytidylyltransferase [Arthrobacter alpinus]